MLQFHLKRAIKGGIFTQISSNIWISRMLMKKNEFLVLPTKHRRCYCETETENPPKIFHNKLLSFHLFTTKINLIHSSLPPNSKKGRAILNNFVSHLKPSRIENQKFWCHLDTTDPLLLMRRNNVVGFLLYKVEVVGGLHCCMNEIFSQSDMRRKNMKRIVKMNEQQQRTARLE